MSHSAHERQANAEDVDTSFDHDKDGTRTGAYDTPAVAVYALVSADAVDTAVFVSAARAALVLLAIVFQRADRQTGGVSRIAAACARMARLVRRGECPVAGKSG